jgi:hypothetical protein
MANSSLKVRRALTHRMLYMLDALPQIEANRVPVQVAGHR